MKTPKSALTFLLALFLLAHPGSVWGQQNNDTEDNEDEEEELQNKDSNTQEAPISKRFWTVTLPGGEYTVALDRISSVSIHEYVLDLSNVVTEVVVDTNGRALVRFYHVRSTLDEVGSGTGGRIVERGKELIDRAGQRAGTNVQNLPPKSYPATSHAGMIEYRLANLNDLKAIHGSVKGSWESGQGKRLTVKPPTNQKER
jgi:hypothetical protein